MPLSSIELSQPAVEAVEGQDELLVERQVADLLKVSVRTIQNWRVRGGGPPYIRISGRCIRYRVADIRRWQVERREEHTSARALQQLAPPAQAQFRPATAILSPGEGAQRSSQAAPPAMEPDVMPDRPRNKWGLYD